jgi:hypothetical protein
VLEAEENMQDKKSVKIKKCPYCFRNISNDDVGFLLRTDGAKFISPALNDAFSPKVDMPYLYFWSAMGIPEDQIDAYRIILDNQGMSELNQELTASRHELAIRQYDTESCGYSFYVEEGALTVYSNTMICPCCHNELPQHFFKYDMLMIGMAGSVASGKTVYMSSLMMNGYDVMQRENLSVRSAAGNPSDRYKVEMEKNADRLCREGVCPTSTNKAFRKPIFLEVTYRVGEKTLHLLVAIYDVAGELIRDNAGSGRTGFVRYMDGYICLIDPAQMHLEHASITSHMPDEERVLAKLRLLSPEEQIAVQQMSLQNGRQVMSQTDSLLEQTASEEYIYERKAETILDSIRSGVGDSDLRQKYMALTIAKSDLLEDLGEIKSFPGSQLLFDRRQVSYGFMNMDRHFLRQDILRQIFDQKVFRLQKNLEDYKESSLFAVSALGCETEDMTNEEGGTARTVGKVRPIRVEEPVLWMVMKYMQERGWLE